MKTTDNNGKFSLKLNLKPNKYVAKITFTGDDNYSSSDLNTFVNVNKPTLLITAKNCKTHKCSDKYFKAKVINKITKYPVKGIKVTFKVIDKNSKIKLYYATTDKNGMAVLKKNLKTGQYKVITDINDNNVNAKKSEAKLTVKKITEKGCCSIYIQISNSEAVSGFRRDGDDSVKLIIDKYNVKGKSAIKQYKDGGDYFFHSITTQDGWMASTGGADSKSINKAIEKLAVKMLKSGKIEKTYLKKIQKYKKKYNLGHFVIKAPNGKYAIVWSNHIKYGKLKPGKYLCVPNKKTYFRQGSYKQFSKNPVKAIVKVAATDKYGVNRRDITVYHWKVDDNNSTLKIYASNDNGKLVGKNTVKLKDNILFKGKFISKNTLPANPLTKLLGIHYF